jgi:hypothetical protein
MFDAVRNGQKFFGSFFQKRTACLLLSRLAMVSRSSPYVFVSLPD